MNKRLIVKLRRFAFSLAEILLFSAITAAFTTFMLFMFLEIFLQPVIQAAYSSGFMEHYR